MRQTKIGWFFKAVKLEETGKDGDGAEGVRDDENVDGKASNVNDGTQDIAFAGECEGANSAGLAADKRPTRDKKWCNRAYGATTSGRYGDVRGGFTVSIESLIEQNNADGEMFQKIDRLLNFADIEEPSSGVGNEQNLKIEGYNDTDTEVCELDQVSHFYSFFTPSVFEERQVEEFGVLSCRRKVDLGSCGGVCFESLCTRENLLDGTIRDYFTRIACPSSVCEWLWEMSTSSLEMVVVVAAYESLEEIVRCGIEIHSNTGDEGEIPFVITVDRVAGTLDQLCASIGHGCRVKGTDIPEIQKIVDNAIDSFIGRKGRSEGSYKLLDEERIRIDVAIEDHFLRPRFLTRVRQFALFFVAMLGMGQRVCHLSQEDHLVVIPLVYRMLSDPSTQPVLGSIKLLLNALLDSYFMFIGRGSEMTSLKLLSKRLIFSIYSQVPEPQHEFHSVLWYWIHMTPCYKAEFRYFRSRLAYFFLHKILNQIRVSHTGSELGGCTGREWVVPHLSLRYGITDVSNLLVNLYGLRNPNWRLISSLILLAEVAVCNFRYKEIDNGQVRDELSKWIKSMNGIYALRKESAANLQFSRAKDLIASAVVKMMLYLNAGNSKGIYSDNQDLRKMLLNSPHNLSKKRQYEDDGLDPDDDEQE